MASIDRQTLRELRDGMVAQARQWLRDDRARDVWCRFMGDALAAVQARPLGELVDIEAAGKAMVAAQAEGLTSKTLRPALHFVLRDTMERVRSWDQTLEQLVGQDGRTAIVALAGHPDVVDETLMRALAQDDALESAMKDVLYDALMEFSERVNPFVADWGLPRLLDQLPLFGKGTLRRAFQSTRADFDKRLEPEIKRFLKGFARKATQQFIGLLIDKGAEPELVHMRHQLVQTMLEQPLSDIGWSPEESRGELLIDAVVEALIATLRHPSTREQLDLACRELTDRWVEQPLGEVLNELGIEPPDVRPFAAASWPAVRAALSSDDALDGLAAAIDEAHEGWLSSRRD